MKLHADKKPFRIIRKWKDDARGTCVEYESDFWRGPTGDPRDPVGYETIRSTASAKFWRNDCSPSVSYWPELKKALGLYST